MNLFINEKIGSVKSLLIESKKPEYLVVLAHGAGAGMDHPFMRALAEALSAHAHVLRFNFPYMESSLTMFLVFRRLLLRSQVEVGFSLRSG